MKTKLNLFKRGEVIALATALLFGCAKTPIEEFTESDMQTVSINTKAAASPSANILLGEDKIYSAVVYIYEANTDKLVNSSTMYVLPAGSGEVVDIRGVLNRKWRVPPGKKDIYVIANPDDQLLKRLVSSLSQTALGNILISSSAADFTEAVENIKTKGMIMTGSGKGISFAAANTTVDVSLNLTRRYARIHLMLRKAKDLDGKVLKVKRVTFNNQYWQSPLFTGAFAAGLLKPEVQSYTPGITVEHQQVTAGASSKVHSDYTPISVFYSFESPTLTAAVSMDLLVEIDGVEKSIKAYLSPNNTPGSPVGIRANNIYRIMGTLSKKTLDITATFSSWTDQDIVGDIGGGGELSVSQSEVQMNQTVLGGFVATVFYASTEAVAVEHATPPAWLAVEHSISDKTIKLTSTVISSTDRNIPFVISVKTGNINKKINVYYRH